MKSLIMTILLFVLCTSTFVSATSVVTYNNNTNTILYKYDVTLQDLWAAMNNTRDSFGLVMSCHVNANNEPAGICYLAVNISPATHIYDPEEASNIYIENITIQQNLTFDGSSYMDFGTGRVWIKNVTFQTNNVAYQGKMRIRKSSEYYNYDANTLIIDNCTFNDFGWQNAGVDWTAGLWIYGSSDGYINNSVFKLGKKGLIVSGNSTVNVINNQFLNVPRRGIVVIEELSGGGIPLGHPFNSIFDSNYITGSLVGIEIAASENNTITKNFITNIDNAGINIYGSYGLGNDERIVRNTTIENNTIQSYGGSTSAISASINVLGLIVKDNYIEGIRGETIAGRNNIGINFVDVNDSLILSNYIYMTGGVINVGNIGIYFQNSKNDTVEKNYVKATANNSVSDIGIGIYITTSSNITRYNNSYINTAQTNSGNSYAIFDSGSSGNSVDEFVSGGDAYGLYNPGSNNTYTNLTVTGTTDGILLSGMENVFINSSFPSNGGTEGATTSYSDNNTIFINTYFGTHTTGGYSYYSYSTSRGENKCYNCSFAEAIYIEDNNAFRLLEFWQGYTNTTGDSPVTGATMSCRNDSSPYTTLWTENTDANGYTSIYNRTYKYYAYATESSPDETWGDIICNSTKSGYSLDSKTAIWTHSWLLKDFWISLIKEFNITLWREANNTDITYRPVIYGDTWFLLSANTTGSCVDNITYYLNASNVFLGILGITYGCTNVSYNHTVVDYGSWTWSVQACLDGVCKYGDNGNWTFFRNRLPKIELVSPANNKIIYRNWEVFNCVWTELQPDNITLYINNTANITVTSGNLSSNVTLNAGTYVWDCQGCLNNVCYWSTNGNWTLYVVKNVSTHGDFIEFKELIVDSNNFNYLLYILILCMLIFGLIFYILGDIHELQKFNKKVESRRN